MAVRAFRLILPNGEIKNVLCDFSDQEFTVQYSQIFEEGDYKTGLRKKDMTIVDIGGNIGLSVLYFKDWAKQIYALEPNSVYYDFLTRNVGMYSNVKTFNLGLGLHNGPATLSSNPADERIESVFATGENKMLFDMVTIDRFFEDNKIEHVDVMKIDCEGSEYPILMSKGFAKVASKIDYIVGEAHLSGSLMPQYIPLILKDYGFKVKWLPFKNLFTTLWFLDEDNKPLTKTYKLYHKTIFEAYR